jgi:hypothetical protein
MPSQWVSGYTEYMKNIQRLLTSWQPLRFSDREIQGSSSETHWHCNWASHKTRGKPPESDSTALIFWDIPPCSPLKINRRFGGMSYAWNQHETGSKLCYGVIAQKIELIVTTAVGTSNHNSFVLIILWVAFHMQVRMSAIGTVHCLPTNA